VGLADLTPPARQLSLFDRSWQQDQGLLRAVDEIRRRFGPEAVRRASEISPRKKPGDASGEE
jgi:hypothetical protein